MNKQDIEAKIKNILEHPPTWTDGDGRTQLERIMDVITTPPPSSDVEEMVDSFDGDFALPEFIKEDLKSWLRQALTITEREVKEKIICSAVKFNEKVWRGHRHGDAINAMHGELSYTMSRKEMVEAQTDKEQGFVTSTGRYVGREEAWDIAEKAGQIIERDYQKQGYLFSGDLY